MADFAIRGTTPLVVFDVDMDLREADRIRVIFRQCGEVVIAAELDRLTVEEDSISLTLTQEETLAFCSNRDRPIEIQIRALLGVTAAACEPFETSVGRLIDDEEVI